MTFTEKVDVLDMLINVLTEHESSLDQKIDRMSILMDNEIGAMKSLSSIVDIISETDGIEFVNGTPFFADSSQADIILKKIWREVSRD